MLRVADDMAWLYYECGPYQCTLNILLSDNIFASILFFQDINGSHDNE